MPSSQTPSITDWLSAIGQVVGAVGTLAAVMVALLVSFKDNRRLVSELRDREAATARLVSATVRRDLGLTFLEIRNDGREAVHDMEVELTGAQSAELRVRGQKVEERNGRFVAAGPGTGTESVRVLRPGEVRRLVVETMATAATAHVAVPAVVILRFTDSAGLRWLRQGHEPPTRQLGG
ncbi:hypothetical protein G9272_43120 [Streptomyces asoensis]|uniref:Uncharacterized protein n=1 Tax=Streptomyces asoensis TaxID=249586 RepID=A0A6M4X0E4_9ACTN|nr:hypothetical protein [Streptomyces asoensis]QJT06270.1 hypothetical protein G9272_43120 [Streptomyces asoensis]